MSVSVPPFPIARFSVDQYHRMIRAGAFTEDDQLELIDGWVVKEMAKGPGDEFSTLVVEVSDTTLATDRIKGRTYA
jgi:hypothetical protein